MKFDAQLLMQKQLIYTIIALLFISVSYKGQRHEIGVQLGMSNLVGDIGRTNYILQKPIGDYRKYGVPFYGGILYRMNFNPYQSVRLNLGYSHIQFSDAHAKEFYRNNRKYSGTNSAYEADLLFEYNFFGANDEHKSLLSPYIFGGVGGLLMGVPRYVADFNEERGVTVVPDPLDINSIDVRLEDSGQNDFTLAIPFGVGLKYKFNYNWALFGELMFRPTFSDAIDYSVLDNVGKTKYQVGNINGVNYDLSTAPYKTLIDAEIARKRNIEIGNPNSKDWVNSITLGLSYSFGRPPCYCD